MEASEALWPALHARAFDRRRTPWAIADFLNLKIKIRLETPPPRTPWLGVLLEPGLLPGSPEMEWLADFIRCLSWSVLDRALSRADHAAGWIN